MQKCWPRPHLVILSRPNQSQNFGLEATILALKLKETENHVMPNYVTCFIGDSDKHHLVAVWNSCDFLS